MDVWMVVFKGRFLLVFYLGFGCLLSFDIGLFQQCKNAASKAFFYHSFAKTGLFVARKGL
jgi:hypothetical protein